MIGKITKIRFPHFKQQSRVRSSHFRSQGNPEAWCQGSWGILGLEISGKSNWRELWGKGCPYAVVLEVVQGPTSDFSKSKCGQDTDKSKYSCWFIGYFSFVVGWMYSPNDLCRLIGASEYRALTTVPEPRWMDPYILFLSDGSLPTDLKYGGCQLISSFPRKKIYIDVHLGVLICYVSIQTESPNF